MTVKNETKKGLRVILSNVLVFRFMGQKELQRMYWPVKVGFL